MLEEEAGWRRGLRREEKGADLCRWVKGLETDEDELDSSTHPSPAGVEKMG